MVAATAVVGAVSFVARCRLHANIYWLYRVSRRSRLRDFAQSLFCFTHFESTTNNEHHPWQTRLTPHTAQTTKEILSMCMNEIVCAHCERDKGRFNWKLRHFVSVCLSLVIITRAQTEGAYLIRLCTPLAAPSTIASGVKILSMSTGDYDWTFHILFVSILRAREHCELRMTWVCITPHGVSDKVFPSSRTKC